MVSIAHGNVAITVLVVVLTCLCGPFAFYFVSLQLQPPGKRPISLDLSRCGQIRRWQHDALGLVQDAYRMVCLPMSLPVLLPLSKDIYLDIILTLLDIVPGPSLQSILSRGSSGLHSRELNGRNQGISRQRCLDIGWSAGGQFWFLGECEQRQAS